MLTTPQPRRHFLQTTTAALAATVFCSQTPFAHGFKSRNERPRVGAIGTGSRWSVKATGIDGPWGSAPDFVKYGDYVALCDADENRRNRAAELVKEWSEKMPTVHTDYRAIIDNPQIDIVHISTPEHWHAKLVIEAMLAGKDVYCEKPLTLTIDEGQKICEVCRRTGRIVQVGTQQRSEEQFITAIALIQAGRLGKLQRVTCSIGGAPTSPELPVAAAPAGLDWNLWQGPVQAMDFRYLAGDNGETKSWSRGHYEFRWWYEYSGGKLTDWGAHHVDIATWGMGQINSGPISIVPEMVQHPVEFRDGMPVDPSRYNTATAFLIRAKYADGVELIIRHDGDNGILFEGTEGRIFVNRGKLTGRPVDDLQANPLPGDALIVAYKNRPLVDHFRNFFEGARDRVEPISDVFSHHRALSTCHLAALAARFNRPIQWDPQTEQVQNDPQIQALLARPYRQGYEIEM